MDWYSTIEEIEDENGKKSQVTRYHWTEAKSQEELYGLGIEGTYLGEVVVVFNGYYDERLGKDGKLTGEGQRRLVLQFTVQGMLMILVSIQDLR